MYYTMERAGGDEDTDSNMSGKGSVTEEEEEEDDAEEDVSNLSGLDNYQLCLKYQQVLPKIFQIDFTTTVILKRQTFTLLYTI